MRRLLVLPVLCLTALAACGDGGQQAVDVDDEPVAQHVSDLDRAVEIAGLSMPAAVEDEQLADLVAELCGGDAAEVASQLQTVGLDADQQADALDALAAGAYIPCPEVADRVAAEVQQALAPTTTVAPPAAASSPAAATGGSNGASNPASASTGGSSGAASGSSSSGSSSSGSSSSGSSSSGAASAGGGDATGVGNSSSSGLTQSVGGGSSSNNATAG